MKHLRKFLFLVLLFFLFRSSDLLGGGFWGKGTNEVVEVLVGEDFDELRVGSTIDGVVGEDPDD